MEATSVRFATAARVLGRTAHRRGLRVPAFRSPPRLREVDRSLRRHESGAATVSVRLKGRPWSAVVADMIEGVVAANRLHGAGADRVRTALWAAAEAEAEAGVRQASVAPTVRPTLVPVSAPTSWSPDDPAVPGAVPGEVPNAVPGAVPVASRRFPARRPLVEVAAPGRSAMRAHAADAGDAPEATPQATPVGSVPPVPPAPVVPVPQRDVA